VTVLGYGFVANELLHAAGAEALVQPSQKPRPLSNLSSLS